MLLRVDDEGELLARPLRQRPPGVGLDDLRDAAQVPAAVRLHDHPDAAGDGPLELRGEEVERTREEVGEDDLAGPPEHRASALEDLVARAEGVDPLVGRRRGASGEGRPGRFPLLPRPPLQAGQELVGRHRPNQAVAPFVDLNRSLLHEGRDRLVGIRRRLPDRVAYPVARGRLALDEERIDESLDLGEAKLLE